MRAVARAERHDIETGSARAFCAICKYPLRQQTNPVWSCARPNPGSAIRDRLREDRVSVLVLCGQTDRRPVESRTKHANLFACACLCHFRYRPIAAQTAKIFIPATGDRNAAALFSALADVHPLRNPKRFRCSAEGADGARGSLILAATPMQLPYGPFGFFSPLRGSATRVISPVSCETYELPTSSASEIDKGSDV